MIVSEKSDDFGSSQNLRNAQVRLLFDQDALEVRITFQKKEMNLSRRKCEIRFRATIWFGIYYDFPISRMK
jgi:hypothetical protein